MVDKRTLEKYEREAKEKNRESWYLSWALDTSDEERNKGITVEVCVLPSRPPLSLISWLLVWSRPLCLREEALHDH